MYKVKEIFYTLQGEGHHSGRPAVFCRFSGCNLWSGREADRHKAICKFCDTDFWGMDGENGGKYTAAQLAEKVMSLWPRPGRDKPSKVQNSKPFVVCTGGEPMLQLDENLVDAFHAEGLEIAVETNGTIPLFDTTKSGIDWICVSPKANTEMVLKKGNELKLVFPQPGAEPEKFTDLEFDHFYLQPMDSPQLEENTRMALEYCLQHPQWSLSLQTHKILNIP